MIWNTNQTGCTSFQQQLLFVSEDEYPLDYFLLEVRQQEENLYQLYIMPQTSIFSKGIFEKRLVYVFKFMIFQFSIFKSGLMVISSLAKPNNIGLVLKPLFSLKYKGISALLMIHSFDQDQVKTKISFLKFLCQFWREKAIVAHNIAATVYYHW